MLESSTSGRLTYFMPPLNLIPLLFLRPLRLVLPSEDARAIRIVVLKATHAPFVAVIWLYERSLQVWATAASAILAPRGPHTTTPPFPSHMGSSGGRIAFKPSLARPALAKAGQQTSAPSNPRSISTTSDNAELLALVQSLSAKVDDLAALIAGQQAV